MEAFTNPGMPYGDVPLLPLDANDDPAGFDYAAFLQQPDDLGYLAEESSGSSSAGRQGTLLTTASPSSVTLSEGTVQSQRGTSPTAIAVPGSRPVCPAGRGGSSPGGSASVGAGVQQQKQRLERRGHTKSRRGCFHCKRRRIKCQETRPSCGHCIKQGLKCEYPAMPTIVHQPQHQIPLFTLQDMRFFQHFLTQCYPHHPIGAEHLWTHEVPCLSHKYEFLMHAILGFAASSLIPTDPSLTAPALEHRLKSIRAIKKTLAEAAGTVAAYGACASSNSRTDGCNPSNNSSKARDDASSFEEGNALIATCYALTFQSVFLDDGMVEFMTFIRGIIIVAVQMYIRGGKLLFGAMMGGDHQKEALEPHMTALPLIEKSWTDAAVRGIRGLEELVREEGREVEMRYWEMILEMAEGCYVSSWRAYTALMEHYSWWIQLPHEHFQRIIDPTNQVGVLLATHWQALEEIMITITEAEKKAAAMSPNKSASGGAGAKGYTGWLKYLNGLVDKEHQRFNEWPMWVEEQIRRDKWFFGRSMY